jgi:23S rRNA (guanosine2251-2'-O)-methyltransferase
VIGVEGGTQVSYTGVDFNVPLALVMAAKAKGATAGARKTATRSSRFRCADSLNSLNVSVATGVVLFEVLRQRQPTEDQPLKNRIRPQFRR